MNIAWAVETIGAVVAKPEDRWRHGVAGPCFLRFRPWGDPDGDGRPNHPGLYGRHQPIDLDENNRHIVDQWCERHPDQPRPVLGWGVCRHGFGLQHHRDGMTEAEADAWAVELNRELVAGADR